MKRIQTKATTTTPMMRLVDEIRSLRFWRRDRARRFREEAINPAYTERLAELGNLREWRAGEPGATKPADDALWRLRGEPAFRRPPRKRPVPVYDPLWSEPQSPDPLWEDT